MLSHFATHILSLEKNLDETRKKLDATEEELGATKQELSVAQASIEEMGIMIVSLQEEVDSLRNSQDVCHWS